MIEANDMGGAALRAGQAATELGVGVQTLHYYEREGLISPPPRSEAGYRLYPPELLERLRFIRRAQALGLSLAEIKQTLKLAAIGKSPCGRVQNALAERLREVDRRLEELTAFRSQLALLAAGLVAWTGSPWPDRVVALVIAGLFLHSSWLIVRDARSDLRGARD